jgi:glycosyltransferase involved in cell wall biosynthesis
MPVTEMKDELYRMEPSVSVIMAVHNGERHVREAVDSILGQTLSALELIVVDDASTDATAQVLATYNDSRLRMLHNQHRVGPAAARNRALRMARAPLIAIQDADDSSFSHRLQTQAEFFRRNPAVDLAGAHAIAMGADSQEGRLLGYPPAGDLQIKWASLFWNPFIHTTIMLRRSALEEAGAYNEEGELAWLAEDYELLSRIGRAHGTANIGQVLVRYRITPNGASARPADLQRLSEEVSSRNLRWLLGGDGIHTEAVQALRRFWFEGKSLSAADARRVLAYNKILHDAFLSHYVAHRARSLPRARFYLSCARRTLAQARHNSHLDASSRRAMLLSTMALAAKAVG